MRKGGKAAADEKREKELAERKARDQEELRRKVIEEQIAKDPIRQYVEELRSEKEGSVDALEYPMVWGTPEEWSNIPRLVARYCIHMQAHLSAVVAYLKERSSEESSAALRAYVEKA